MLDGQKLIDKLQELIDAKRAFMDANLGMGAIPWSEFNGMIVGWELAIIVIQEELDNESEV